MKQYVPVKQLPSFGSETLWEDQTDGSWGQDFADPRTKHEVLSHLVPAEAAALHRFSTFC